MAAEETEFPLVVRGYDRAAVDDALRDLRREILQLSGQNAQLATELRDTSNRLIEAQQTISEVGEPTYAGVGAKAALILSTAEEQAKRLIQDAEQERDRIRKNLAVELDEQRPRFGGPAPTQHGHGALRFGPPDQRGGENVGTKAHLSYLGQKETRV